VGRNFQGTIDKTIDSSGMLVSPGFIDTHVHCGHRASHRLITNVGRPDYFGKPFLEIAIPREGTKIGGDPRYANAEGMDPKEMSVWCDFTAVELLRNGITTMVEFGAATWFQEGLCQSIERYGNRAYLGSGYDIGRWVGNREGRLKSVFDEKKGEKDFKDAIALIQKNDGGVNGRIRGILVPREQRRVP